VLLFLLLIFIKLFTIAKFSPHNSRSYFFVPAYIKYSCKFKGVDVAVGY
jgi:hypothetical protein